MFVRGVVVGHYVQFDGGVGGGDHAQEAQELLVAVAWVAGVCDLPGGDFQCGE